MTQKIVLVLLIAISFNAFASDKGLHITYEMNFNLPNQAATQSTTEFYFQDGNMYASMEMPNAGRMVMISKDGRQYTLFPEKKTYMDTTDLVSDKSWKNTMDKPDYVATGEKKKIAGYECDVYKVQRETMTTTFCSNQALYEKHKDVILQMQKMNKDQSMDQNMKGFPLEVVTVSKDKTNMKNTIVVKSIEQNNFKGKFDLPKDYTQEATPTLPPNMDEQLEKMKKDPRFSSPEMQEKLEQLKKMTQDANKAKK